MKPPSELLPGWVQWTQRPFPDCNMLLLPGATPAIVDSGFVGHADQTAAWVASQTRRLDLVINSNRTGDAVMTGRA